MRYVALWFMLFFCGLANIECYTNKWGRGLLFMFICILFLRWYDKLTSGENE